MAGFAHAWWGMNTWAQAGAPSLAGHIFGIGSAQGSFNSLEIAGLNLPSGDSGIGQDLWIFTQFAIPVGTVIKAACFKVTSSPPYGSFNVNFYLAQPPISKDNVSNGAFLGSMNSYIIGNGNWNYIPINPDFLVVGAYNYISNNSPGASSYANNFENYLVLFW